MSSYELQKLITTTRGESDALTSYTHAEITQADCGAHEVRTWISLPGTLPDWRAEVLAYAPVVPWATGCGFVHFTGA